MGHLHHREGIMGLFPHLEPCKKTWIVVGALQALFLCLCLHMALARSPWARRCNFPHGSWGMWWKVACCFPSVQQCWFQEEDDSSIGGQNVPLGRLQTRHHVVEFRTKFRGSLKLPSLLCLSWFQGTMARSERRCYLFHTSTKRFHKAKRGFTR
jgi:hypothetical protein